MSLLIEATKTPAQLLKAANEHVRDWLNRRLDSDAVDIAKLYQASRDRLTTNLRGIYDTYLSEDPSYVKARSTGAFRQMQAKIDRELDQLTDEVGQRATAKMADMLNQQPDVLERRLARLLKRGPFFKLPVTTQHVLGELTTSVIGGATFEDRIMAMGDDMKRVVTNDLRRGLINGDDFATLRAKISKTFGVDKLKKPAYNAYGSVKVYKNEARRQWNLLMTQQGERMESYMVWFAMIDDPNVTPGCVARHGLRIDEDLDGEAPPRHYNCRCTIMLMDDLDEIKAMKMQATAVLSGMGYSRRQARMEEAWDPGQHPRDDDGKFAGGGGSSPEDVKQWADDAGATFDGIQSFPSIKADPLVLITDNKSRSTGVIPLSKISKKAVQDKVDEIRAKFAKEAGWAWGHEILQPVSTITAVMHEAGAVYKSIPWRSLPREAVGYETGTWGSLLTAVATDRPDSVLLRKREGHAVEVRSWASWRPVEPTAYPIDTLQGSADDSAVIQPPWDVQVARLPREILQRWPALRAVTFPVIPRFAIALVDQQTAENITTGAVDPSEVRWNDDANGNFLQALMTMFWRQGHPPNPHFVFGEYATEHDIQIRTIVNVTTGEVIYAADDFASDILAPYTRVAAAVLERDGRIWAIMPRGLARWVLPGGHIDAGESARDAVVREMLEETGQHVRVVRLLGTLFRPWSRTMVFLCMNITKHKDWSSTDETDAVLAIDFRDLATDERLFLQRHNIKALWGES
jgi:ADP-ribose pyrophosphatase YjhB (NUDIX family)